MPAPRSLRHAPRTAAVALALSAGWLLQPDAYAIEAIELEARSIDVGGIRASDVRLRLELPHRVEAGEHGSLRTVVTAASVDLGPAIGRYRAVRLNCAATRLDEPEFGCMGATLTNGGASEPWLPRLAATLSLAWRLDSGAVSARGVWTPDEDLAVRFAASYRAGHWRANASLPAGDLGSLRAWIGRALRLPPDVALEGRLAARLTASGRSVLEEGSLALEVRDLNFTNATGTVVGENVDLRLAARARTRTGARSVDVELAGDRGQALLGPALLDLGAHPLTLRARSGWTTAQIAFDDIAISQRGLADAHATATVQIAPTPLLRSADVEVRELRLPQAFTAYAQIALAATDFGALDTRGRISGSARVRDNALVGLDATLHDVQIGEARGKFWMENLHGDIHWGPTGTAVQESTLAWTAGGAYGLSGDGARIHFRAEGAGFALTRAARLPIFDGALSIGTLRVEALGSPDVRLQFEADLEPISLQRLAPAFGWPELAGKVSGRIPRVELRDRMLTVAGDVEARVFGGRVVGSGLRLQDPLGPWPRLYADVRAYDLDLAQVTQTFSIGSITGRLEGHLLGLELFNWSPVAFDALLQTPPRDRSPHRISARAIGNLSNIGGGGSGVVTTLQSGLLQFFDRYSYDRLGIRCRLANEVCLMSGIEPAGDGYYILKGKGLPRIDIVGNAGRVSWPQLVGQIATQMRGEGEIRIE